VTQSHLFERGWLTAARRVDSPNFDARPDGATIDVIVLHHISLPAGHFAGDAVERLFTNRIEATDPLLGELSTMRVSAHFFVRRSGQIVQFVDVAHRAWHAGVSCWRGRERVNDFSVGIEIEGDSDHAFTVPQYTAVNLITNELVTAFSTKALTTHAEIALGRKVDPGPKFDLALIDSALSL
jgi:N-acetyl-anhydromuramoyl-L-alanine amidase